MTDTEHETFEIHLSAAQLRKFKAGLPFQLNSSQLSTGTTGNKVQLTVHRKHYKRMLKNIKSKKGFRFTDDIIAGGSLWNKVKSVWNVIKEKSIQAGEAIKKHIPNETVIKEKLMQAAAAIKEHIPKETVKKVLKKGVDAVIPTAQQDIVNTVINKSIDYAYSTKKKRARSHIKDLANELKPEIKDAIKMATPDKYKDTVSDIIGSGLKRKRFVKGSIQAREWGEKMKAARERKTGKGFGSSLFKAVAPSLASAVVGKLVGKGIRNKRHVPYGQLVDGVPSPFITDESVERIKTHGLQHKHHGMNGLIQNLHQV